MIFTIGHNDHPQEYFLMLLQQHGIEAVVDVRSFPVSAFCPHFDKKQMEIWLAEAGIEYHFLGNELGGRREDKEALTGGKIDTDKIRKLGDFQNGIERLLIIVDNKRTAIMCGEGDPRRCHRHWLIAQELLDRGLEVEHILRDGNSIPAERERSEIQLGLF